MKYKIWDKQETLVTPIGEVLSPQQVIAKYPMAGLPNFSFVICDAPINMGVFMEYEQTKEHYKSQGAEITEEMTQQEVLNAISAFENKPPEAEATAEERIAAALEFNNLLNM